MSKKQKRPQVSVCLCVVKDGKVLLHKRKGGTSDKHWGFAGGHLEFGEEFEEAALRELAEEAGPIVVTKPEFWAVANTIYDDRHYIVIIMKANWLYGKEKVMEPDKCYCWDWFDWNKLPKPLLAGNQYLVDNGFTLLNDI